MDNWIRNFMKHDVTVYAPDRFAYFPPEKKKLSWWKKLRGRFRMFWGFCPECNSDAPKMYDCKVCNWYTSSQNGMPIKPLKKMWWERFLQQYALPLPPKTDKP